MTQVLLLLSGGIDSPVAGFLMKEKKFDLNCIHFGNEKFAGKESKQKAIELAKLLKVKKLFYCNIDFALKKIAEQSFPEHYFVLMKRLMFSISEKVAERNKINFLVSGESLAQVSSQTIQNLKAIESKVKLPILRPLVGLNKDEIVQLAYRFNSFEISKGPEICDRLGPKHPSTRSQLDELDLEEQKIGFNALVQECFPKVEEIKI